jgi:two-component system, NarL family, sensor histidine kinase UhpB
MRDGERSHQTATSPPPLPRGAGQRLLRVPLFYKILIANAAIVLAGTAISTGLNHLRQGAEFPISWILIMAVAGLAVTIFVNAVIIRVALSPLKMLEQTATRIQSGDVDARVPYSPLLDTELERLTRTFNGMLENLEHYRHRLSGIAARALNAEEQERKRIARELHDDTAQYLAALLIRLRLLRGVHDSQARDAAIDEIRDDIGEALERIRRFARGLRPPALDELGLVPALEYHVRSLSESVGVPIKIEAEPIEELLTEQAELALYRIAQEAMSNAIRHANPQHVVVRIRREGGMVTLAVSDDGDGFSLDEISDSEDRGLGLFGMKERAAYIGGQVTIRSQPGKGTEIRVVVPVAAPRLAKRTQSARPHEDPSALQGAAPNAIS